MNFRASRREDRLSEDAQEEAAEFFGYKNTETQTAQGCFMQDFYIYTSRINHFADVMIRRSCRGIINLRPGAPKGRRFLGYGVEFVRGELHLDEKILHEEPLNLIRVFRIAQKMDTPLSPEALETVRKNLGPF